MRPLAHVGGLVAVAVNRLLEDRIGSSFLPSGEYHSSFERYSTCCSADFLGYLPKFPVPPLLSCLPSTKCKLQFDGTARALRASAQGCSHMDGWGRAFTPWNSLEHAF